jgi:hypothetical protein
MDGIVVNSIREHYNREFSEGNFDSFERDLPTFPAFENTILLLKTLATQHKITFITARSEAYRDATREWIDTHMGLEDYTLLMRPEGDTRKDYQLKFDILKFSLQKRYNIIAAFDDNKRVVKMYREQGITTWINV